MAEPSLQALVGTLGDALRRAALGYSPEVRVRHEGRVLGMADGVLRIAGLPGAESDEVLRVGARATALVMNLGRDELLAVALNESDAAHVGDGVRRTGAPATVSVGDGLLGRVIDPLGRPLDGLPLRGTLTRVPVERTAPRIFERAAVHTPLLTGILAIDAMFPIGRGQRELVLGDEGTGKTAIALDVMLRQRSTEVVCVYVAIGRRRAETWQLVETLRARAGRWIVVAAPDDESPGLRYLAPYAGTAVAEHFAYRGEQALIVYDDLSSHAVAWRELSLLLRRAPGREAYPGDMFYLHSRLLERSAQLSSELGGGSLTALPLAALERGRLTAYIPTNLISITDGQIVLSQSLFSAGYKPAIDATLSVSRIGAKAQPRALQELASGLRLDYAGFLELEAFSRLGTRLEAGTQRRIDIGRAVRRLLTAERLAPLSLFGEVARLLLAARHDLLLRLPESEIPERVKVLSQGLARELPQIARRVERDGFMSEGDRQEVSRALERLVGPPAEAAVHAD